MAKGTTARPASRTGTEFFDRLQANDAARRQEVERRVELVRKAFTLLGKLKQLIASKPMQSAVTKSTAAHATLARKLAIAYLLDHESLENMLLDLNEAINQCEEEMAEEEFEEARAIFVAAAKLTPNVVAFEEQSVAFMATRL